MSKILIFTGAFNPVHEGHKKILIEATRLIQQDKTIIGIDKTPPWKNKTDLIDYQNRLKMVNNSFKDTKINYKIFENKKNYIYTIDILNEIKKTNKENELFFLIGQDQYIQFQKWNSWREIDNLCTIIVCKRFSDKIIRINKKHIIINNDLIKFSSSELRANFNVDGLGNKNFNYIKNKHLYLEERVKAEMSEKRFLHTLNVIEAIEDFAFSNNFTEKEKKICYQAALLHDITKEFSVERTKEILGKKIKKFKNIHCAHGLSAFFILKKEFKIKNKEVLNAVKNHVVPSCNISKIGKALFCADKLEKDRKPSDISDREKLYMLSKKNINEAYDIVLKLNNKKYEK